MPRLTDRQRATIRRLAAQGWDSYSLASKYQVPRLVIWRALDRPLPAGPMTAEEVECANRARGYGSGIRQIADSLLRPLAAVKRAVAG